MKTCVIMQPTYLPWLGYFDLMKSADVFVFLDHVQYSKQSWQQRNRIRDGNGEQLLTMHARRAPTRECRIDEVMIDHSKKPLTKHLKSIRTMYARSRNFGVIFPELEELYGRDYVYLVDLNMDLIKYGAEKLGISTETIRSSELEVSSPKVGGIIEICRKVGCDRYLSPVGARNYIEENDVFAENGIVLAYQDYEHVVYDQIGYEDFVSHLSFIDYLFNERS